MRDCRPGTEFVFKMPNGAVIGRAKNIAELVKLVKTSPLEAVLFHAKGGHFAPWLAMVGEGPMAARVKALAINDKTVRVALLRVMKA